MHFLAANLKSLNLLRRARGLREFSFRPHCGEAGDIDHLAACLLTAESINHGINLRHLPAMEYVYYLAQIGLSVSPLSNHRLFVDYRSSPFLGFLRRGHNVTLSSDDPLILHFTRDSLLEEYVIAAQVWKLSPPEVAEIMRNSLRISGYEEPYKRHWQGPAHVAPGPRGNDIFRTNVPQVRLQFRYELLQAERQVVAKGASLAIGCSEDELEPVVDEEDHDPWLEDFQDCSVMSDRVTSESQLDPLVRAYEDEAHRLERRTAAGAEPGSAPSSLDLPRHLRHVYGDEGGVVVELSHAGRDDPAFWGWLRRRDVFRKRRRQERLLEAKLRREVTPSREGSARGMLLGDPRLGGVGNTSDVSEFGAAQMGQVVATGSQPGAGAKGDPESAAAVAAAMKLDSESGTGGLGLSASDLGPIAGAGGAVPPDVTEEDDPILRRVSGGTPQQARRSAQIGSIQLRQGPQVRET